MLLVLDGDIRSAEPFLPGIEFRLGHGEAGMAGAHRAVCRRLALPARGLGTEQQQHGLTDAQEQEHAGLAAIDLQAEHARIERLGRR